MLNHRFPGLEQFNDDSCQAESALLVALYISEEALESLTLDIHDSQVEPTKTSVCRQ